METNPVLRTIANALTPYVGRTMAESSIASHCKRLGLDVATLDGTSVERLLHQISLGLNVFIGRDKAEAVIRGVRLSLGGTRP